MQEPTEKPTVQLTGADGNAFFIIGTVGKALRRNGADKEYVEKFQEEAMSGDYNNVLCTAMKYVDVE